MKLNKVHIKKLIFALFTSLDLVMAHQDVPIPYEDGVLHNLPEVFSPALFSMAEKKFTISGKDLIIPMDIQQLLEEMISSDSHIDNAEKKLLPLQYSISFSASWHHGPSIDPPYLIMKIEPVGEKFYFKLRIDLVNVSILSAGVGIEKMNNDIIYIPIEIAGKMPTTSENWQSMIGEWRSGDVIVKITEDHIEAKADGVLMDYPNGKIRPGQDGMMILSSASGKDEDFFYNVMGDNLQLDFEHYPHLGLARKGSKADELWRKLDQLTR